MTFPRRNPTLVLVGVFVGICEWEPLGARTTDRSFALVSTPPAGSTVSFVGPPDGISADGRFVLFRALGDGRVEVFVHDRQTGERRSQASPRTAIRSPRPSRAAR